MQPRSLACVWFVIPLLHTIDLSVAEAEGGHISRSAVTVVLRGERQADKLITSAPPSSLHAAGDALYAHRRSICTYERSIGAVISAHIVVRGRIHESRPAQTAVIIIEHKGFGPHHVEHRHIIDKYRIIVIGAHGISVVHQSIYRQIDGRAESNAENRTERTPVVRRTPFWRRSRTEPAMMRRHRLHVTVVMPGAMGSLRRTRRTILRPIVIATAYIARTITRTVVTRSIIVGSAITGSIVTGPVVIRSMITGSAIVRAGLRRTLRRRRAVVTATVTMRWPAVIAWPRGGLSLLRLFASALVASAGFGYRAHQGPAKKQNTCTSDYSFHKRRIYLL